MAASQTYDVLFSYARPDAKSVETVAHYLSDLGLKVWFDKWSMIPGAPWQEAVGKAMYSASSVAFFLGPKGVSAPQKEELELLRQRMADQSKRVVSVVLPEANLDDLPPALRDLTVVDLHEGLDDVVELNRFVANIRGSTEASEVIQEKEIGDELLKVDDAKGALEHYKRALQKAKAVHGDEHPLVVTLLSQVGKASSEVGDYKEAQRHLEEALDRSRAIYGAESKEFALASNDLGNVLSNQGRYEEAEPLYRRALEIAEAVLGPDDPNTASTVNNLASLYYPWFAMVSYQGGAQNRAQFSRVDSNPCRRRESTETRR